MFRGTRAMCIFPIEIITQLHLCLFFIHTNSLEGPAAWRLHKPCTDSSERRRQDGGLPSPSIGFLPSA